MSELKEILGKINQAIPVAKEDVTQGNPATLQARAGRRRSAQEELIRLKRDYRNAVLRNAAFIIVVGDEAEKFGAVALDKYGCQSFKAESFFEELAGRVDKRAYAGRESSASLFDLVGRHLEDMANNMDLASYPMLVYSTKYSGAIADAEQLAKLLERAVIEQVGSELAAVHVLNKASSSYLEGGYTAKTAPIILSTTSATLARDLYSNVPRLGPKGTFLVSVGKKLEGAASVDNASNDSVKAALTAVKNALEGKGFKITKPAKKAVKQAATEQTEQTANEGNKQ